MDGPEIPPFFVCPISLQVMKDPVTLSTGMTYDRESISKWLFSYNHKTCPVTKQTLTDFSLTPNSTLLRLIQSWHSEQAAKGVETSETLKPTFDSSVLQKLIDEVREPKSQIRSLRKIKFLIQESDDNRRFIEEAGVTLIVASFITKAYSEGISNRSNNSTSVEEATNVLYLLKPSQELSKKLAEDKNGELIGSLALILQRESYQARIHAALLLKSIFKVVDASYKAELCAELFEGVAEILKDQNSNRATMATLLILVEVLPFGRNRIRAVEAGTVPVLVELLAENNERRVCEVMLGVLEMLCERAEGRSAFLLHPASVAAVAGKILRVSQAANEKAVKILLLVCRFCVNDDVVQEMVEVGGVAKLFMVVQSECTRKAKEKAKEILGLHFKSWIQSPCFPSSKLV